MTVRVRGKADQLAKELHNEFVREQRNQEIRNDPSVASNRYRMFLEDKRLEKRSSAKNKWQLDKQALFNRGKLEERKLINSGDLAIQRLENKGKINREKITQAGFDRRHAKKMDLEWDKFAETKAKNKTTNDLDARKQLLEEFKAFSDSGDSIDGSRADFSTNMDRFRSMNAGQDALGAAKKRILAGNSTQALPDRLVPSHKKSTFESIRDSIRPVFSGPEAGLIPRKPVIRELSPNPASWDVVRINREAFGILDNGKRVRLTPEQYTKWRGATGVGNSSPVGEYFSSRNLTRTNKDYRPQVNPFIRR